MKHAIFRMMIVTMTVLNLSPITVAAEVPQQSISSELQAWLATAACRNDTHRNTAEINPVTRFYQMVGYIPIWVDGHGLRPHGESLLAALGESSDDGLEPGTYLPPPLGEAMRDSVAFSDAIHLKNRRRFIQLDVALTEGILRYAQHLSQGRVRPETLSRQWLAWPSASARDIPAELAEALIDNRLETYIKSLHPKGQAYRSLRKALQQYETIKKSGGWPTLAPGPTLRIGDQGARVDALMRRLKITEDLSIDAPAAQRGYDTGMEAAVKRFQRRHGLAVDGLVGKRTRYELNIPVEQRISQLQLNMERWRWLPDNLGDRYLMVNIPAFALHVVDDATRVATMRAIVGKKRRQAPIMSGRMTYLEFNPYWNIPRKIARKDILPRAVVDPGYLARQGIRVFDGWDHQARELDPTSIAWRNISTRHFPYRLRQEPSTVNALGQIKFMFPNRHSVYIHDTPGKALFNRQERSLSSGCVRVETPLALAQYLLKDQGWDHGRMEAAIAQGQRETVVLGRPIAVHLVYFTAWTDADGTMNFREDIYGRDRDLLLAITQTRSNLTFCSNDAPENPRLAVGNTLKTPLIPTADASVCVASPIKPAGKVAGHPMTGI